MSLGAPCAPQPGRARLSRLRFDNGAASYLEVLYAENELFAAQLSAVRSASESSTELINVYKAVGGGWLDEASRLAPGPQLGAVPGAAPSR